MTLKPSYHPFAIALARGEAAFDCFTLRGVMWLNRRTVRFLNAVGRKVLFDIKQVQP
jgi:hypothetical protein